MGPVSRWALASLASLPVTGLIYLLGLPPGDRMVAADQGLEMAFYWSPLVFLVIDTVPVLGKLSGWLGWPWDRECPDGTSGGCSAGVLRQFSGPAVAVRPRAEPVAVAVRPYE